MRIAYLSLVGLALVAAALAGGEVPVYPDRAKLLVWKDDTGKEHPIKTPARAHILANMEKVMGPLSDASRKVPLDVQVN